MASMELTQEETEVIKAYRAATAIDRDMVLLTLEDINENLHRYRKFRSFETEARRIQEKNTAAGEPKQL